MLQLFLSYNNPDQGSDHGAELTGLFDAASDFPAVDAALFVAMQQYWSAFTLAQIPTAANVATWEVIVSSPSPFHFVLLINGFLDCD